MKKINYLAVVVLSLLCGVVYAQRPSGGGGPPAGMGKMPPGGFANAPKIGRLYGKIVDADSKQPIPYASVAIMRGQKDSVVGGSLTAENGDFNIEQLPMGRLKVKVTSLGFKGFMKQVMVIPPDNVEQDLGDIAISADAKVLNTVEVKAEKATLQMGIDRKIFNVEKNIHSQGGTAEDVMKTVPSVTVDADGNAQLRNNSAALYIDGKPTTLSLNQIPASQIEQVEIITNPSAKFDASTTGGILNIVMKKNTAPGYNGIIAVGAGTGNHYNAMANLNIKQNPFNLSLSYNLNSVDQTVAGYALRTDHPNGILRDYYNTYNMPDNNRAFNFGRMALDYNLNNRNVLTLSENIVAGNFNINDHQLYNTLTPVRDTITYGDRNFNTHNHFNNYTTELAWKKSYPKKGKELSASGQFSYSQNNSLSDNLTNTDSINTSPRFVKQLPTETLHNLGSGHGSQFILQIDYANPVTDSSKIELGARSFMNNSVSDFQYNVLDPASDQFINNPNLSNHFDLQNIINAAYVNYSGRYRSWGYQAGLRFEQSSLTGVTSPNETKVTAYNYPSTGSDIFNSLFPSLYLSKKVAQNEELQLNFSRKTRRPDFMALMPNLIVVDKFTYRQGNPTLKPQFINLAELNYSKLFGEHNLVASVYLRQTDQPITNITIPYPLNPQVNLSTFINAQSNTVFGTDNTLKLQVSKNVEWLTSVNIFDSKLRADTISNEGWAMNAKMNLTFKLPASLTLQVSGNYESKRIELQGYTQPQAFSDVSLKKDFGKFASLTLSVNDVFDSRKNVTFLSTSFYDQEQLRRREARFIKLGFQLRFGKVDASIFRKRKPSGEGQDQQQMDM